MAEKRYDWDQAVKASKLKEPEFMQAFESIKGYSAKKDEYTKKAFNEEWVTSYRNKDYITQAGIDAIKAAASDDEDDEEQFISWKQAYKTLGMTEKAFMKAFEEIGGYSIEKDNYLPKAYKEGWVDKKTDRITMKLIEELSNSDEEEEEEEEKPTSKSKSKKEVEEDDNNKKKPSKKDDDEDEDEDEDEENSMSITDLAEVISDFDYKSVEDIRDLVNILQDKMVELSKSSPIIDDDPNAEGSYRGWTIWHEGKIVKASKGKNKLEGSLKTGDIRADIDEFEDEE